jgi:hypothetical protein
VRFLFCLLYVFETWKKTNALWLRNRSFNETSGNEIPRNECNTLWLRKGSLKHPETNFTKRLCVVDRYPWNVIWLVEKLENDWMFGNITHTAQKGQEGSLNEIVTPDSKPFDKSQVIEWHFCYKTKIPLLHFENEQIFAFVVTNFYLCEFNFANVFCKKQKKQKKSNMLQHVYVVLTKWYCSVRCTLYSLLSTLPRKEKKISFGKELSAKWLFLSKFRIWWSHSILPFFHSCVWWRVTSVWMKTLTV